MRLSCMIIVQDEIKKKLKENNRLRRNRKNQIQPQIKIHYMWF